MTLVLDIGIANVTHNTVAISSCRSRIALYAFIILVSPCGVFAKGYGVGTSSLGSNGKPHAAFVFDSDNERDVFRSALADLSECFGTSPTKTLYRSLLRFVSETEEGRWAAEAMYSDREPSALTAYRHAFHLLAVDSSLRGDDAHQLVKAFLRYAAKQKMLIDDTATEMGSLVEACDFLHSSLVGASPKQDGPESPLDALHGARSTNISDFVSFILEHWIEASQLPSTFIALKLFCEVARAGVSPCREPAIERLHAIALLDRLVIGPESSSMM